MDVAISSLESNHAHLNTHITMNGKHHLVNFLINHLTISLDSSVHCIKASTIQNTQSNNNIALRIINVSPQIPKYSRITHNVNHHATLTAIHSTSFICMSFIN
mgnify:CR=1 FL=1